MAPATTRTFFDTTSIIHRIIPENVDIAVGGGGAATCGASCTGTGVIGGEGADCFGKERKTAEMRHLGLRLHRYSGYIW